MNNEINILRKHFEDFEFKKLFTELGWNSQTKNETIKLNTNDKIEYEHIAEAGKIPIIRFDLSHFSNKKDIHLKLKSNYPENLCVFSDQKKTHCAFTYYDKVDKKVRSHEYFKGQNTDWFFEAFKFMEIPFGSEKQRYTDVKKKLDKFNTKDITKKFFSQFQNNHLNFQEYITGIKDKKDKKIYSLVILNRLIFIYFLQKKGFINNGNTEYLEEKLKEKKVKEKDIFYSDFLQLLFFEGFAKEPDLRSDKAKKELSGIKYLNGGLFTPHPVEDNYKNIRIKDQAFEETFKIFKDYKWHIKDNKGGAEEISHGVLGHIFEKYINYIQRKQVGAYYTRDEITYFFSKNTISQTILDKLSEKEHHYENLDELLGNLTPNLCKTLLTNEDSILNELTILDPSVGSGAFLISALSYLIDIYSPIIRKIQTSNDKCLQEWFKEFKNKHKSIPYGIKKSIILNNLYGVDLMKEAVEVCKLRLFLSLVSSAIDTQDLEPLPNIDFNILCGDSLIGLLKDETESETENLTLFNTSYTQLIEQYNKKIKDYKTQSMSFDELRNLKEKIRKFIDNIKPDLNKLLYDKYLNNVKFTEVKNGDKKIKKLITTNHLEKINLFHWDFCFNKIIKNGGFDIIITNPPWGKIEMMEKEFFNQYNSSITKKTSSKEFEDEKEKLLKNIDIKKQFLFEKKMTAIQIQCLGHIFKYQNSKKLDNYRLFIERCFQLLNKKGYMGLVIPYGLFRQKESINLRKYLFKKITTKKAIGFKNKLKSKGDRVFDDVHPSYKILLLIGKNESSQDKFPSLFRQENLNILDSNNFSKKAIWLSNDHIKTDPELKIPELYSKKDIYLIKKINNLYDTKIKIWKAENKGFNQTDDSRLLTKKKKVKSIPVYEGKKIWQYNFNYKNVDLFTTSSKYLNKDYTLIVRATASDTNERSLIASIIPKNRSLIRNSLNVISIKGDKVIKHRYILWLQAFLNSHILDYLMRFKIDTRLNLEFINSLPIPDIDNPCFNRVTRLSAKLTCIDKDFNDLANEFKIDRDGVQNEEKRWKIQGEIDAIVAHIYGLDLIEYEYILNTFTNGKNQKRLKTIKKYALDFFKKKFDLKKCS